MRFIPFSLSPVREPLLGAQQDAQSAHAETSGRGRCAVAMASISILALGLVALGPTTLPAGLSFGDAVASEPASTQMLYSDAAPEHLDNDTMIENVSSPSPSPYAKWFGQVQVDLRVVVKWFIGAVLIVVFPAVHRTSYNVLERLDKSSGCCSRALDSMLGCVLAPFACLYPIFAIFWLLVVPFKFLWSSSHVAAVLLEIIGVAVTIFTCWRYS